MSPTAQCSVRKRGARRSSLRMLMGGMTLALVATGCGSSDGGDAADDAPAPVGSASGPAQDELQELYAAAQEAGEDTVSVYTRANAADYADPNTGLGYLATQFQKQFPEVAVEWTGFLDNSIYAQLDGQAESGNYTNDVLMFPYSGGVLQHQAEEDRLLSFAPKSAEAIEADDRDPEDRYITGYSMAYGMLYNTTQYQPDALPETLDELLTPEWQDKFGLVTPNGSWPADYVLATLFADDRLTEDQYETLLANATLYQDNASAMTAVAQGRSGVLLWAPNAVGLNMARTGAPVAVGSIDTQVLQRYGISVAKDAPHSNAAKLFMAWMFTPEAQTALAHGWYAFGQMPDAPAPENSPGIDEFTIEQLPLAEEGTATQEFYEQVTKKVLAAVGP